MGGRSAESPGPRACPPLVTLGALVDAESDLDALQRVLMAFAVHPQGAGCHRVWLSLWNARAGRLEGWLQASAKDGAEDLGLELGRARRAAPSDEEVGIVRAWSAAPEEFPRPLARAWRTPGAQFGGGAEHGDAPWAGGAHVGVIALRRGARHYAVLVGSWETDAPDATATDAFEMLRLAAERSLAIQQRAAELRRRTRQLSGLAEFARTGVSAINLAEGMHLLARLAAQGINCRGAVIYRVDEAGELAIDVAFGAAALRQRFAEGFHELARRVLAQTHVTSGESGPDAPGLPPGLAGETTVWAALPIRAYGRAQGVLVVYDGHERHPSAPGFERGDLEFLGQLADHGALLLEHARQVESLRRLERRQREQDARLREMDRHASVGELAARVAQEARNPLASIGAFARRTQRELAEDDPRREYLDVVLREVARLETMILEQLEYAKLERPRLRMQSLNAVVQEALHRASETIVRRRVRLLKKLAPDLPQLLLDSSRIQRVIENVISYALECVPVGGRIHVESRRTGAVVVAEIAFDRQRQTGELLEQLFVPFTTGVPGGAAVGLSVAQQIVREHGGEIRVRAEGEWGTVFSFTLPVRGNEDRRGARERRSTRIDRRRPPSAA